MLLKVEMEATTRQQYKTKTKLGLREDYSSSKNIIDKKGNIKKSLLME